MSRTTKMLLILDAEGRVVGAAHDVDKSSQKGLSTGIKALAGQRIVRADVPEEIASLESGRDLHLAFSRLSALPQSVQLDFNKVERRKVKH